MAAATTIPEGWRPQPTTIDWAMKRGFSHREIREAVEEMTDWCLANEHRAVAKKKDWDAALRNWMRRNKPAKSSDPTAHDPLAVLQLV